MTYRPHYLNVDHKITNIYASNRIYRTIAKTIYLGRKYNRPKTSEVNKSGRHFMVQKDSV